jgi:PilZ domain
MLDRVTYRFDRAYYRVVYPLTARPIFRMGEVTAIVVDLSEEGFRILIPRGWAPRVGDPVEGRIRLVSGTEHQVQGEILRVSPPQVAGRFEEGIPFGDMMAEQRWLQQRFFSWLA